VEQIDGRSDIFSLGCVFYELLSGEKAFDGNNSFAVIHKIMNSEAVPVTSLIPSCTETIDNIIMKALSKDLENRYQSCMEFAYDLSVAARQLKMAQKESVIENVIDHVYQGPFFENFDKSQIKPIISASNIFKVKRGDIIIEEGHIDDSLFIILSGKVNVYKGSNIIDSIKRGGLFRRNGIPVRTTTGCNY
jgi:eukaryotic-like serine/threonine-protein kinase